MRHQRDHQDGEQRDHQRDHHVGERPVGLPGHRPGHRRHQPGHEPGHRPPTVTADGVALLSGFDELVERCNDDAFARAEAGSDRVRSYWAGRDGSVGWVLPSRRFRGQDHVVALGATPAAGVLARVLAGREDLDVGSVTLPRDADHHLAPEYVLDPRADWEWLVTWDLPPQQPREDAVGWLGADPDRAADADRDSDEIRELLRAWSPRHDVDPGDRSVLRWCGVRGRDGALVAVAAHTEHRPGVPHLASIATHGAVRGQGYGGAVTAWLTRALLAEGAGWVTLGMYSDNDVARRLYRRLGFGCDHRFTGGRLVRT